MKHTFFLIFFLFSLSFARPCNDCKGNLYAVVDKFDSLTLDVYVSLPLDSFCKDIPNSSIESILRNAAEKEIQKLVLHSKKYLGYAYESEFYKVYNRKGYDNGRKAGTNIIYKFKKETYGVGVGRRIHGNILVIGVLKNNVGFSERINRALYGVDILHGKKLGYFLDKEVMFIEFDNKEECLKAAVRRDVDLVIASIEINEKISGRLKKTEPYFKTGAVIAGADHRALRLVSKQRFETPRLKICVLKNSSAHGQARGLVKKDQINIFDSFDGLYKNIISRKDNFTEVALIDEIKAVSAPYLFVIGYDNQKCFTWKRYVVVGRSRGLIKIVNEVIKGANIDGYYSRIAGRDKRK